MNIWLKILGIVTIILLLCTVMCGVWIKSNPVDDIGFHFALSLSSVVMSLITISAYVVWAD